MSNQKKVFAPEWPKGLEQDVTYTVKCDDAIPDEELRELSVVIACDGDVHLSMKEINLSTNNASPFPGLRCRNYFGGGRHLRTHQALLWLAQAIRLDNEELSR